MVYGSRNCSAMKSDLVVSRLSTGFCTSTGKKWVGVKHWNKLNKFENCCNKHFQRFPSLHHLWRLLLTHKTASFLPCCYFMKSASEKCVLCLELLTQQSVAMSTKWRFCKKNYVELAPAIFFLCKFSEITTLSGEINH